jgi:undecaprenyl-diphosphatase
MQQLVTIDLGALFWFQSIHSPWLDPVMLFITHLGDLPLLLGIVFLVGLICVWGKAWRTGVLLVAIFGLAVVLAEGVKVLVDRPRPDVAYSLVTRTSAGSFPSGHAVLGMTAYGTIAVVLARRLTSRRVVVLLTFATAVLVLAIGFSRLYLGIHFVTDVVGGWIAGGAMVLLFLWADQPTPMGKDAGSAGANASVAQTTGIGANDGVRSGVVG